MPFNSIKTHLIIASIVIIATLFSGCDELPTYPDRNTPPIISQIDILEYQPDSTNPEGLAEDHLRLKIHASDLEGDVIRYKFESIDGAGFVLDPARAGSFSSWDSIDVDISSSNNGSVKVTALDPFGNLATRTFELANNTAPYIVLFTAAKTKIDNGETVDVSTGSNAGTYTFSYDIETPGYDIGNLGSFNHNGNLKKTSFTGHNTYSGLGKLTMRVFNDDGEATSEMNIQVGKVLKREKALNLSAFLSPYTVATSSDHKVYVHNSGSARYLVLDTALNVLDDITYSGTPNPAFLTVDETTNPVSFYTTSFGGVTSGNTIRQYNLATGDLLPGMALAHNATEALYITKLNNGDFLVSANNEPYLERVTPQGVTSDFGTAAPSGLLPGNPRQTVQHPTTGNVYVTLRYHHKILVYTANGDFLEELESPVGFDGPHGIALDASRNVLFVADTHNDYIQVFRISDHQFLHAFKLGNNFYPKLMSVGADGLLYIPMSGITNLQVYSYN